AIDFGIIIDGAVIIVEYIAYKLTTNREHLLALDKTKKQQEIDNITYKSSSKMMTSAVFGQLIILIVFIPILSLSGVEGKMFKPMAMAFSFALIGAMLLCFTYVPVISSIFLKPEKITKNNISKKIMRFFYSLYQPVIKWALFHKKAVIFLSLILLIVTAIGFSKMGGEFIPTLDEGDFVIQPVLKTGTSLSKTIEITTKIEEILLANFPEVEQVVSRIGAAEVPTDPMSMEESDVIIKLKPKSEWVSANSKDELADLFKEKLSVLPGIEYEFTQPIEMRFNELITGVRADVAVKIFGEDLEILVSKADEIKNKIKNVEGASDIIVEKIDGLPQMMVKYNRKKVARYGLDIETLNNIVSMAFAGKTLGSVFEGERKFDMVIRLQSDYRKNIEHLRNLYVDSPLGLKIPLHELAEIEYTKGPAKISRDDTKRRIVIGINVRNTDMETVVNNVRSIIDKEINLPPGYTISYGGQFENLNSAKKRLKLAVPIALLLIFILLHFAFNSVRDALMIFSAIPLAAIGGVALLAFRGLPFSISAGVGFIALFGIAVLNGIVLIEHLKSLKKQGITDVNARILKGTKERLRPVILTAAAAALGFLPMAVSTNAGAEVQRPLATVVIGGLITSTILTLVVLPVLYALFETKKLNFKTTKMFKLFVSLFIILGPITINAQQEITLNKAIEIALENNFNLKIQSLETNKAKAAIKEAFNFENTSIYYLYDKTNLGVNNKPLETYGIQQSIAFPSLYITQKKANSLYYETKKIEFGIAENNLIKNVTKVYYNINFLQNKLIYLNKIDSLYQNFSASAKRKFELGETNYLESLTAKSKHTQLTIELEKVKSELEIAKTELQKLIQVDNEINIDYQTLNKIEVEKQPLNNHPLFELGDKQNEFYAKKYSIAK
ncbi:MAG TPA: CusA/CzcA family heavy metal efflux RND transporter, partial [Flavobacteriaceae bacterium]|nr:CusA/CzcA family heavy metal efflux RND transporter [Flavobacteriaceae bacterium]